MQALIVVPLVVEVTDRDEAHHLCDEFDKLIDRVYDNAVDDLGLPSPVAQALSPRPLNAVLLAVVT